MAHAARDGMPGLPIARQFNLRGANMAGETTLDPNDSISVREATKTSSIPSSKTASTQSTTQYHPRCVELESQSSLGKQHAAQPIVSPRESASPRNSASWLSRLHPSSQTIEDAVLGTSDGMTVPFALTASLAGIAPNARYVMLAGLAELTAGALSMALGGALQARSEREAYDSTTKETQRQVRDTNMYIPTVVDEVFSTWNFSPETLACMSHDLSTTSHEAQTDFVMRFYHGLSAPDSGRYFKSATTLGSSYFIAGLLGIFPYMVVKRTETKKALYAAIAVEAVALYVFGYCKTGINTGWKGKENVIKAFWGAASMVIVGAIASGLAVGLIIAVNSKEHIAA